MILNWTAVVVMNNTVSNADYLVEFRGMKSPNSLPYISHYSLFLHSFLISSISTSTVNMLSVLGSKVTMIVNCVKLVLGVIIKMLCAKAFCSYMQLLSLICVNNPGL